MFKQYCERSTDTGLSSNRGVLNKVCAALVEVESLGEEGSRNDDCDRIRNDVMVWLIKHGTETYKYVQINPELPVDFKVEGEKLFEKFCHVLTDLQGHTHLVENDKQLSTTDPIRIKGYTILFHSKTVGKKVEKMLEL